MFEHNLKHLAIIMDGNARWATKNNKTIAEGYIKGAKNAKNIITYISNLGIDYVTLYAFSSENWNRPKAEVNILLSLFNYYIKQELDVLKKHRIRLNVIGSLKKLSNSLQRKIKNAITFTKDHSKMVLTIAFAYGSRLEILDACHKILKLKKTNITEEEFKNFLYDPCMPDVDLLIRPSGVYRLSNFLLWQSAYAELYFTNKLWPDFSIKDLNAALINYSKRTRNFGARK